MRVQRRMKCTIQLLSYHATTGFSTSPALPTTIGLREELIEQKLLLPRLLSNGPLIPSTIESGSQYQLPYYPPVMMWSLSSTVPDYCYQFQTTFILSICFPSKGEARSTERGCKQHLLSRHIAYPFNKPGSAVSRQSPNHIISPRCFIIIIRLSP